MTGIVVLGVALVASVVLGVVYQQRNGRFRSTVQTSEAVADDRTVLSPDRLGVELGERATLVQFSSAFCSPCRATKVLLADVTQSRPDVVHVEIDAESHLDLVRELDIMRTPTVLVLDGAGAVVGRASGLPRREQVEAAIAAVPAT